ncbi:hypothetical protein SAMN04487788_2615, partial [Microbacterium testaceum StLB037]
TASASADGLDLGRRERGSNAWASPSAITRERIA